MDSFIQYLVERSLPKQKNIFSFISFFIDYLKKNIDKFFLEKPFPILYINKHDLSEVINNYVKDHLESKDILEPIKNKFNELTIKLKKSEDLPINGHYINFAKTLNIITIEIKNLPKKLSKTIYLQKLLYSNSIAYPALVHELTHLMQDYTIDNYSASVSKSTSSAKKHQDKFSFDSSREENYFLRPIELDSLIIELNAFLDGNKDKIIKKFDKRMVRSYVNFLEILYELIKKDSGLSYILNFIGYILFTRSPERLVDEQPWKTNSKWKIKFEKVITKLDLILKFWYTNHIYQKI